MPRPLNERQALEQERAERREFVMWRIRQAELRLAAIEARLAALNSKAGK